MDIKRTSVLAEGSCNACTERTDVVYSITFRAMSVRVCEKCRTELIKKLKEA